MKNEKARSGKKFLPVRNNWDDQAFIAWYATGDNRNIDAQLSFCDGTRVTRLAHYFSTESEAKEAAKTLDVIIEQLNAYKAALGELYAIEPEEAEIRSLPWEE